MTSAALTDILCARSATLMVSGTWTSRAMNSCGAGSLRRSFCWLRPPRPPDLPPPLPPARQPSRLAGAAGLSAGFLREASSDQVEETSAVLMVFFEPGAPGLASFLAAPAARRRSCRPACAACPTAARQALPARERAAPCADGSASRAARRLRPRRHGALRRGRRWTPPAAWRDACRQDGRPARRRVQPSRGLGGFGLGGGLLGLRGSAAACEEEDSDLVASTTGSGLASSALGSAGSVLTSGLASWATGSAGAGAGVDSDSGCAWTSGACSLTGAGASAATDSTAQPLAPARTLRLRRAWPRAPARREPAPARARLR